MKKFSENDLNIMKKYYEKDNLSVTKIARLFNASPATISKYLKKVGVEIINKQNKLSFDLDKDIIPEYNKGTSLSKLAKQFNTTIQTLSRHLKVKGIEVINRQNETKFDESIFDSIDTEEKAYWLGFIFADGYISSRDNTFELSLKGSDVEHLEKFHKFTKHTRNIIKISITKTEDKEYSRCRWSVVNKHL